MVREKHYDECYFLNYNTYSDINLFEVGSQKCPPSYSFGPIVRKHYVLHFVLEGKGTLYLNNEPFHIVKNEAFIIPPNVVSFVKADETEPWNYIWIHFNGPKAIELLADAGMSKETPVFRSTGDNRQLIHILNDLLQHSENELRCIGNLYHLFHELITHTSSKPQYNKVDERLKYVKTIIDFISVKYSEPIKIQDLSDLCGLERSYLTKLFKSSTGYSPQEYLISFRMKRAKKLLSEAQLPIQHVAYSVGYNDQFTFSKAFRKTTGVSPTAYRETHLMDDTNKKK